MGQESVEIATVEMDDFSGGINSNRLSTKIEDRDAVDCLNVHYYNNFLQTNFGWDRVNSTIGGVDQIEAVNGGREFVKRDGTTYQVVVTETKVWYKTATTWIDITGAVTIANAQHSFVVFNDLLIGVAPGAAPWKWSGSGNIATLGGTPPEASYVTSFNGRVCLVNCEVGGTPFPSRVYYSELDNPESWDTVFWYWEFETDDGLPLTGARPIGKELAVYKRNSIALVSGYGLSTWNVDREYVKNVGAEGHHSIIPVQVFLNNQYVAAHIFLGYAGLYMFDGTTVTRLSEKFSDYIKSLNPFRKKNAVAVFYEEREQYWLFASSGSATENDVGFIYDIRNNGCWPMDQVNANCVFTTTTSNSSKQIWFGNNQSEIFKLNEGVYTYESNDELVDNGSMEDLTDWTDYGTPVSNTRSNVQFLNGSYSRRVETNALNEGCYQDIATEIGYSYRLYAYLYVQSGDAIARVEDTSATLIGESSRVSSANWTRVEITFVATATTTRVVFSNDEQASSLFFVDDVTCRNLDYNSYWDSKWMSLGSSQACKITRELGFFLKSRGGYTISARARNDFTESIGSGGSIDMNQGGAIYGAEYYGEAVYGGSTLFYVGLSTEAEEEWRFIQLRVSSTKASQPFDIERVNISAKVLGRRFMGAG